MGEFFLILIGYFVFLLMNYKKANDIDNENKFYRDDSREYAINFNKPVWFEGYKKDQENYLETKSNRRVFKGIDKNGLKRWYYLDTKHPMQYVEDKRIFESFKRNRTAALTNGKKWCIAENFWDDSIVSLDNSKPITYTILDVFKYEPNDMLGDEFDTIREKIKRLDVDEEFNYMFKPSSNDLIENPLNAKEFFNSNHVYNNFIIPQLNFDELTCKYITTKRTR